jgi:hypothetical protein
MNKEFEVGKILESKYNCNVIFNEENNTCLYSLSNIGKLLNIKNINDKSKHLKNKFLIKTKTKGGLQNFTYINYNDLLKIFNKTRKPNMISLAKDLNININNEIFTCFEAETIKCILDSFNGEEMIEQYKINIYLIDLYFPKYKLAIECDEYNHISKKKYDNERENKIKLEIKEIYFMKMF